MNVHIPAIDLDEIDVVIGGDCRRDAQQNRHEAKQHNICTDVRQREAHTRIFNKRARPSMRGYPRRVEVVVGDGFEPSKA